MEELILPFVLDHARPSLDAGDERTRALLAFAGEEAKHIHLFKRFRDRFERDFVRRCEVIGLPREIAAAALALLHIEWMTQKHGQESARDDRALDPLFHGLLRHC